MLRVENLSVSFTTRNGKSNAVANVNFELKEGQILGIVGESGSGKSVTCYSLLGLIPSPPAKIESGSVNYKGTELLGLSDKALRGIRGNKIAMIFQDPMTSLNPYMTIGAQIAESLTLHHKLSKKEAKLKAVFALEEVGIKAAKNRINSYPYEFSGGMRQRVMIALALATEPEILIADEPTTALDVTIQAQILELLQSIQKKRKLAIIFISHDLSVVNNVANHILVMKNGHVVESGTPEAVFQSPEHDYTKKLIAAIPNSAKAEECINVEQSNLITVKNLHTQFRFATSLFSRKEATVVKAVNNISLDIRKGEILGLVGESGSGKSTFGRTLMRLTKATSGEIYFDGNDLLALEGQSLKKARKEFQMIFQDPYASLNPRMTVFDTLAEPILLHGSSLKLDVSSQVNQLMDDVGLERSAVLKYPHEFSGGQRQRIAIARAIASEPKFIVADEPVSALDVTIQAQILELLLSITQKRNLTMLFISHDLAVVRYLCDRVAVMQAGSLVEFGECEQIFNAAKHEYTRSLLSAIPTTIQMS